MLQIEKVWRELCYRETAWREDCYIERNAGRRSVTERQAGGRSVTDRDRLEGGVLQRGTLEGGVLQRDRKESHVAKKEGERYLLTQQYSGAPLGPAPVLVPLSVTVKLAQESRKLYQSLFGVLQLHRSLRQVALLVLQCHAQEERGIVQCESNSDVETDVW